MTILSVYQNPPAYQFDEGKGEGTNNWLVHLEGGGWCNSVRSCSGRSNDSTGLGSSNKMVPRGFYGILSSSKKDNPNFYKWNRILVRYCDGSSFTGDADKGSKVYLRGARVFDAIMEDLLERGMKDATNALLCGCSAGGLASIMHCDKFQDLIATTARVKCLSDGGYFLHGKDVYGGYHFEYATFDQVVGVHGSAKNLPQTCTSKIKPSLCFYPQNVIQHIRTPLFILNSVFDKWQLEYVFALTYLPIVGRAWVKCQNNTADCSFSQLKRLEGLRSEFLNTILTRLGNPSSKGWFIDSCYTHCQSLSGESWHGPNVTLNHKVCKTIQFRRPMGIGSTTDVWCTWLININRHVFVCVKNESPNSPNNNCI
ncbi:hypothetical protein LguiA_017831 [Lonicera macranthoides]